MRFVTGYLLPLMTTFALAIGVLAIKDRNTIVRLYDKQIEQLRDTQKATGDRITATIDKRLQQ